MRKGKTFSRDHTDVFVDIMASYVVPLLHGALLEGPQPTDRRIAGMAEFRTAHRIVVHIPDCDDRCLVLKRIVPFSTEEIALVRLVVEKIHTDRVHEDSAYHLAACDLVERSIARLLDEEWAETIYRVIQTYTLWAMQGGSGSRTAHTTGIRLDTARETGCNFFDLKDDSAVKSLGETPDVLLSIDRAGNILGLEQAPARPCASKKDRDILAPGPFAEIALWAHSRTRVAVRLTENGEILIFRDKALAFAKRRSCWRSLPHKALLDKFLRENSSADQRDARMAAYLTVLDLAFSGKGGCIGIIERDEDTRRAIENVNPGVLFASPDPNRTTRMLQTVIKNRKFFQIPRPLRATLCTLDGALVIDETGTVLTAGAILKTTGCPSAGGGRSAAAQALAERGLGVKVSRDGHVEIYDRSDTPVIFA